jgi:hypothetical protein
MILVVSALLFLMCVFLLSYYGCVLLVVSFTIFYIAVFYVANMFPLIIIFEIGILVLIPGCGFYCIF